MLDHHIQRKIVYKLALTERLRFSELKPDELENKLFTYHLKKVMAEGLVAKNEDGRYELTPEGRRYGVHVLENSEAIIDRAYSVLFLVIRRKSDGAWLLYKRKSHPLLGRTGFMHTAPNALEEASVTAKKALLEKTGLSGEFTALGSGFFRVFEGENLESFTNFTLLVCEDATGELNSDDDELAEYFWAGTVDQTSRELLPNMPTLLELYGKGKTFFIEQMLKAD